MMIAQQTVYLLAGTTVASDLVGQAIKHSGVRFGSSESVGAGINRISNELDDGLIHWPGQLNECLDEHASLSPGEACATLAPRGENDNSTLFTN
jgi:hypothetical protein